MGEYRKELQSKGFTISAIVCDGQRGLINSYRSMPVQMCQLHQVPIIRRYISKNPRKPAAIELKKLTAMMKQTDKESFEAALNEWFDK